MPKRLLFLVPLILICSAQLVFAQSKAELVCQNQAKYATGGWNFARQVYGGDGKKYPGTRKICCSSGGYIYEIGSGVTLYKCKKGYVDCKFEANYKILEVTYPAEHGIKVTYNTGKSLNSYMYYDRNQQKYPAPLPVPEDESKVDNGLIDPRKDGPKSGDRDKWEEWFDTYSEHVLGTLVHRIDPNGGDACLFGETFASLSIRYGPDHKVILDTISNMTVNPMHKGPQGERSAIYYEELFEPLKNQKATHCMKIHYSRSSTGFTKFPKWHDFGKLHGELSSWHVGIQYRISGKTITGHPLKACCGDNGMCHGYVYPDESCAMGKSKPGIFGEGSYTPCSICTKVVEEPVESVSKPEDSQEHEDESDVGGMAIGCCIYGKCSNRPNVESCASIGEPLWPARTCPASGAPDPCAKAPPPEPSESQPPLPAPVPGACMLKDGTCRDVQSKQQCFDIATHHMFMKNTKCQVSKQGGCCDGISACYMTNYSSCNGEFFTNGCPSECPPQIGRCLKLCEKTRTQHCRTVSRADCALAGGQQFFLNERCQFESDTLRCESKCDKCEEVIGSYDTKDGKLIFNPNCHGQRYAPEVNLPIAFTFECTHTRDITVHYENGDPPLYLQVIVDGKQRLLRNR